MSLSREPAWVVFAISVLHNILINHMIINAINPD